MKKGCGNATPFFCKSFRRENYRKSYAKEENKEKSENIYDIFLTKQYQTQYNTPNKA